jgi:N-acetylglucosaminyldiphosphoundecaprenol N-acetyl-beta-D-mannosaminyltransferase
VTGAHGVVFAQDHPQFRTLLNGAVMNTLDGQPVAWIARWRGFKVTRITGREIVWDVVAQDTGSTIRHVLFGSTAAVTDAMTERLRERDRNIEIAAINPPFGGITEDYLETICNMIDAAQPTIVWVGLSTPKQEDLAARLSKRLPNATIVAIGAAFDFVAELKPVAPYFVTRMGLEWLFRLLSEPRRLFRRYAETVPRFLLLVAREWQGKGRMV